MRVKNSGENKSKLIAYFSSKLPLEVGLVKLLSMF